MTTAINESQDSVIPAHDCMDARGRATQGAVAEAGIQRGWKTLTIDEVSYVNPTLNKREISDDLEVSFVPMPAVGAGDGFIDVSQIRPFSEVKKGFTNFIEGDVLFAKITPCMENGKMAIAHNLKNGIGFGSTEFHVLRPKDFMDSRYIYYFVSNTTFRNKAGHNMTGAVGQKRVSTTYLKEQTIPVPPLDQQKQIVAKIEELFSHIDAGIEALKQSKQLLKQYRQSVLKAAVTGELSKEWRERNADKLEPASKLLERILTERRQKWEAQQLEQFKAKGKMPKDDSWKKNFSEPKKPICKYKHQPPESWALVSLDEIVADALIGLVRSNEKQFTGEKGVPYIKMNNIDMNGGINLEDVVRIEVSNEELIHYKLKEGDILFNTRNSVELVGKTAMATDVIRGFVFNNNIMRIRLSNHTLPEFVAIQMCALPFRAEMEQVKKATTSVAAVYGKDLFPLPLLIPSMGEQVEIVKIAEERLVAIDQVEKSIDSELQRSERLKQSVLQSAFKGDLI